MNMLCIYIYKYIYIYIIDYICGQHVHLRWGRSDESVRVWSMLSCRAVALVTSLQSVWHDGIVGARGLASDSRSSASGGTDLAVKTKSIGNLESSVLFLGCFLPRNTISYLAKTCLNHAFCKSILSVLPFESCEKIATHRRGLEILSEIKGSGSAQISIAQRFKWLSVCVPGRQWPCTTLETLLSPSLERLES